jgi:pyridoxal/pyridoxine/pyridoxamine kinase
MLVLAGLTAALVALSLSGVAVVALPTLVIAAVALSVRREQRKFR